VSAISVARIIGSSGHLVIGSFKVKTVRVSAIHWPDHPMTRSS
jgi:hypothetical protein